VEGNVIKKSHHHKERAQTCGTLSQCHWQESYFSSPGQLAIDPKEGKIVASDIKGQTARVLENIKAFLKAADCSLIDVVQTIVYLSSMELFGEFNDVYASYFGKYFPARATVGIELMPGALVEISVIAYKE
jgi:2-iminobutanoate/2-iminopropanoate deaminase